jgi:flotillin
MGSASESVLLPRPSAHLEKRAEAFSQYNDAAVLQMLIQVLPQIAKEVAAPISAIDQLTIVSTDGAGALPKQVNDNVVQTLALLKTSTGLDLEGLIKRTVDGVVDKTRDGRVLDGHQRA